jgi:hypothetical protein
VPDGAAAPDGAAVPDGTAVAAVPDEEGRAARDGEGPAVAEEDGSAAPEGERPAVFDVARARFGVAVVEGFGLAVADGFAPGTAVSVGVVAVALPGAASRASIAAVVSAVARTPVRRQVRASMILPSGPSARTPGASQIGNIRAISLTYGQ